MVSTIEGLLGRALARFLAFAWEKQSLGVSIRFPTHLQSVILGSRAVSVRNAQDLSEDIPWNAAHLPTGPVT